MGFKDLDVSAGGGEYLKLEVGATKVRVVSLPVKFWEHFDSKQRFLTEAGAATNPKAKPRYCMWAIERKADGKDRIVPWFCGVGIVKDIKALSINTEYAFDDLPPYDIIVNRVGTTAEDTRYTLTPARQNTELTAEEKASVEALQPILMFLRDGAVDASEIAPF